ncbi:MAG: hypothetical protein NTV00_08205 [Methylococcales bacterium]|nr:hypothetical protein [Methylococcales bacterium]
MVLYRRNRVAGGTYFFTVTLRNRSSDVLVRHVDLLRDAFRLVRAERPFTINTLRALPPVRLNQQYYTEEQRNTQKQVAIMTAILFDTLELATKLKAVGFTEDQTRVIVDIQKATADHTLEQAKHDYHLDDLATKRDLKDLETGLKHEIELLRADTQKSIAETHRAIAETKAELIRWVVGVGLLQTTIVVTALLLKITSHL